MEKTAFNFITEKDSNNHSQCGSNDPWNILVIDDDVDVHKITKLVFSNCSFEQSPVNVLSAYSKAEAEALLQTNKDIALAIVDVVMEEKSSGLDLIKYIRNKLNNKLIRLVIRTGQPGYAPEEEVIKNYEINDYKVKSEVTDLKLKTMLYSSLRSYRDLSTLEKNRTNLRNIIASSAELLSLESISSAENLMLEVILSFLHVNQDTNSLYVLADENGFEIVSKRGIFKEGLTNDSKYSELPLGMQEAINNKSNIAKVEKDYCTFSFQSSENTTGYMYIEGSYDIESDQLDLLELFIQSIAIAINNKKLGRDLKESQFELLFILGEVLESRSIETGSHVRRVAEISKVLALSMGFPDEEAEYLKAAAPFHDIGKIGIPDHILNKPGKLTANEFEQMKEHAEIGYRMLANSKSKVIKMAATIAREHHEKWDGTGYPRGLKGEEINMLGQVVALADVFDALMHKRCYKDAWGIEDAVSYINNQANKQFSAKLVSIFNERIEDIKNIVHKFSD